MREVPEEAVRGTREGTGEETATPHFRLICNGESRIKTHHLKICMNTAPLLAPLSWRSSFQRRSGCCFARRQRRLARAPARRGRQRSYGREALDHQVLTYCDTAARPDRPPFHASLFPRARTWSGAGASPVRTAFPSILARHDRATVSILSADALRGPWRGDLAPRPIGRGATVPPLTFTTRINNSK